MQAHTTTTPLRLRTPATLASWLHKVLDSAVAQVPQLCLLGARIYEHASWQATQLEQGLSTLHDGLAAIEGRLDTASARQLMASSEQQVRVRAALLIDDAEAFRHRSTAADAQLRPLLMDFLQELRSLENAVHRSIPWLAEMDGCLGAAALDETGGDGAAPQGVRVAQFRSRLALLQGVIRNARHFHASATRVLQTRPALCVAVQREVQRACGVLEIQLKQACALAGPTRAGVAALFAARSDAQIWVAQALSQLLRLEQAQHSVAREVAALRHRCGLLVPGAQELETVAAPAADLALH